MHDGWKLFDMPSVLTHRCRVTHTCVNKHHHCSRLWVVDQTIIWTNAGKMLIGSLGKIESKYTNFHSGKCVRKCRLHYGEYIVSVSIWRLLTQPQIEWYVNCYIFGRNNCLGSHYMIGLYKVRWCHMTNIKPCYGSLCAYVSQKEVLWPRAWTSIYSPTNSMKLD